MRAVQIPNLSFSHWYCWENRNDLPGRQFAGVYLISLSRKALAGTAPKYADVSYIGMTNSKKGLAGRLAQFWQGIRGIRGRHAGGDNVFEQLQHYDSWKDQSQLFVAIMPVEFDIASCEPEVLLKKGWVAFLEYEAFAEYRKHNPSRIRPPFNEQ